MEQMKRAKMFQGRMKKAKKPTYKMPSDVKQAAQSIGRQEIKSNYSPEDIRKYHPSYVFPVNSGETMPEAEARAIKEGRMEKGGPGWDSTLEEIKKFKTRKKMLDGIKKKSNY